MRIILPRPIPTCPLGSVSGAITRFAISPSANGLPKVSVAGSTAPTPLASEALIPLAQTTPTSIQVVRKRVIPVTMPDSGRVP